MSAGRFKLTPDVLALLARWKARNPRRVQRAEYRARLLERATANYRRSCGPPRTPTTGNG